MAIRPGKYPQLADADWLRDQYEVQRKSTIEIAENVGCSPSNVQLRLQQFGIRARGRWENGRKLPRSCRRCGEQYIPTGQGQKFCSNKCRYGTLICEQCGGEFTAVPEQTSKKNKEVTYKRKFCSEECRRIWFDENTKRRWINQDGYVVIPNPSMRRRVNAHGYVDIQIGEREGSNNGRVLEHRWVMEQRLGRRLLPDETVHHKNGHKDDNDRCPKCPVGTHPPEIRKGRLHCTTCGWESTKGPNLELWTVQQPKGQRVEDKIAWAVNFLAEYGDVRFQPFLPAGP